MIDPDMAMMYVDFVRDRHNIWEARQRGETGPWTDDPILRAYKFTNVFRILDPGSQFVLTDLWGEDIAPADLLMRLFLYRHTGRVELWERVRELVGAYPTMDFLIAWKKMFLERPEVPVFTNAYLVYPQSSTPGTNKVVSIFDLTARLFSTGSPEYICDDFFRCETQDQRFKVLSRTKGVGDFMAMQILTDWGYTPTCGQDRENEMVALGPGAVKGAKFLDPQGKPMETFQWAHATIDGMIDAPSIPTEFDWRKPSWMDIQNTLCEFSKYVRYTTKPVKDAPYRTAHPGLQPTPVLPSHW